MTPPRISVVASTYLKRQYAAIRPEIDAAIARVVESGYYVGGPEVAEFEREWAAYCGTSSCVAVGSGTAALNLGLRALDVGPGDEVITVSFTLSATLDAIVATGARPVLVDVDPQTYTMDPSLLAEAITARTKAVLPVHIYGHPVNIAGVLQVARSAGVPVVFDAAEAHGALYEGAQPAARGGSATCYSFYPTKNLGAMGDAGSVVTNDEGLAARVRMLRQHGWNSRFHSAVSSMNSRMDELQAAVLRTKLPYLDQWNQRRRAIAAAYEEALANSGIRPAPHASWAAPCYYLYVLATPRRNELRAHLDAEGIDSDIYWPEPPHLQPAFADLGHGRGSLPITERLCNEVLSLPMFAEMTDEEVERVCASLRSFSSRSHSPARTSRPGRP